jgi:hypothetical protein
VAVRLKAWVCGRSITGVVGSNPYDSTDFRLLCMLHIVWVPPLRRADHFFRGVLPDVNVSVI